MTNARIAIIGSLAWFVCSTTAFASGLDFQDFWVAETPPGAMATAGFARIVNASETEVRIVGAESSACERVEFHRTETSDGVAKMTRRNQLAVPAEGELELAPGGTHLMLIGPAALHAGERVSLTFELEGGQEITREAEVRTRGAGPVEDPHAHHH